MELWSDEHEKDSGSDPPGSDLEPGDADTKRPAQVTAHTLSGNQNLESPAKSWSSCLMCFRLVSEGHVPYVNAFKELPDEMKLAGKDLLPFRVQVSLWSSTRVLQVD